MKYLFYAIQERIIKNFIKKIIIVYIIKSLKLDLIDITEKLANILLISWTDLLFSMQINITDIFFCISVYCPQWIEISRVPQTVSILLKTYVGQKNAIKALNNKWTKDAGKSRKRWGKSRNNLETISKSNALRSCLSN